MTIAELKKAMNTDAMKLELAAFLTEKNVETGDDLIQAMADFAASKGCNVSVENMKAKATASRELDMDELEHVAGGQKHVQDNYPEKVLGKAILEVGKTAFGLYHNPIGTIISWFD